MNDVPGFTPIGSPVASPPSTWTPALTPTPTAPGPSPGAETQQAQEICYQDPRHALDAFLTYLYHGEYEKAARLYDDPYPFERRLITPESLDPTERLAISAEFLEEFCYDHGTCLEHKIVDQDVLSDRSRLSERIRLLPEGEVFIFGVEFYKENGEILEVVIPVGEGSNVVFQKSTEFGFVVAKIDGCYRSLHSPPWTA